MSPGAWTLLATLVWLGVVLGIVAFVFWRVRGFLRHAFTLMRTLQHPGGLGRLLSEDTRHALREAGRDPDALEMDGSLEPELRQRVTADLIRALGLPLEVGAAGRVRFTLRRRGAPPAPRLPPPTAQVPPSAPGAPSYQVGGDPGSRLRLALSVAVVAVAAALYFALR